MAEGSNPFEPVNALSFGQWHRCILQGCINAQPYWRWHRWRSLLAISITTQFRGGVQIEFDISSHIMVPRHRILDDDEAEEVLSRYNIEKEKLSKITTVDPAVKEIGADAGDVIEITRDSETAGEFVFYRLVIE